MREEIVEATLIQRAAPLHVMARAQDDHEDIIESEGLAADRGVGLPAAHSPGVA
jgi:hypothetical protein